MKVLTNRGTFNDVYVNFGRYEADGSLYVELWDTLQGPVAVLSKCFGDSNLKANETYLNENSYPWAAQFLEENKIAVIDRSRTKRDRHHICPVAVFDEKIIG